MAVKTITIDMDAYRRLKRLKREGESFSEVIKRNLKSPVDLEALISNLQGLSDQTMDAVEEGIAERRVKSRKHRVA